MNTDTPQPLRVVQPCELGYWCPICRVPPMVDGQYDERMHWSEYGAAPSLVEQRPAPSNAQQGARQGVVAVSRMTKQLIVRVPRDLYDALAVDAEANGRTVAQSVRFLLRRALEPAAVRRGVEKNQ